MTQRIPPVRERRSDAAVAEMSGEGCREGLGTGFVPFSPAQARLSAEPRSGITRSPNLTHQVKSYKHASGAVGLRLMGDSCVSVPSSWRLMASRRSRSSIHLSAAGRVPPLDVVK